MFKGKVPSTHHATDATWSKWIALITQHARIGNPNRPGILEIITNWPEGENFGLTDEKEQEQVTRAEEGPPYNQLPAEETRYALFTDGSCRIVGMNRKWKAAVWSPTRQVAQATEGEGGSSQLAELKAVQLALDIAEREKWPKLYLYTDSWMVANALRGWLDRWKKANWQHRGKPIWAADEWKDIATRVEKLPVKVCHVDAHVPKSRANEEHQNNEQVIHDCETCAAIKQAKRVKPLWYGRRWSKCVQGYRVSQKKAQMVRERVIYLGYELPSSAKVWGEPVIHDCLETIEATYSSRPELKDTPLEDAETWFTDGSSYVVSGRRHAGYAVTTSKEVIESGPLPTNTPAQKAEIIALIRALELAKGKEINIYTGSRYAFGVVHAHGAIWKERGLLNSQGKSIKHAQEILRLLDAIQLPEKVAIMHIKAHQKVTSVLEEGNMLADREAKEAAKGEVPDKAVEAALIPDGKVSIEEKTLEPQWEGPFQVFLTTFTAIKIKEQKAWIHHSRVKKAPEGIWKATPGDNELKLKLTRNNE
ncbi:hypothetical protein DUI87_34604 [Hirundo rustica rustica]|uniref:RNase H type-1 domain-containing protein n=1 Tax=Hirundo rustica rustica TaxID=333673 RepID=A0A3M0IJT9_HIRRU|nr:hypothetical protein DUI87_34604 [Hirundo rustica rustica]